MRLHTLLEALDDGTWPDANPEITGIRYDSRQVRAGDLFVALPGMHTSGHLYIDDAICRGAAAIVHQQPVLHTESAVPHIRVANVRSALALLASQFWGQPGRRLRTIGVTGTDGKTTTSYLIAAVLDAAGYRSGLIGTIRFKIGARQWDNDSRQTTPEAPDIQELLAAMALDGVQYAVIEATSHGLALDRVLGCEFDVAVLTNLTGDHLDFHGTFEEYRRAKSLLFAGLGASADKGIPKTAIVNLDDSSAAEFIRCSTGSVLTYGADEQADIRVVDVQHDGLSLSFRVQTPTGEVMVRPQLVGSFNVSNCLAALAAGYSQQIAPAIAARAIEAVPGIPGRMERIDEGQPFGVIVDYAHTADSLQKVLRILRPLTLGRLIVVFGCAGERDRTKRPVMGRIAAAYADFIVLTNEDPRFEDEHQIIEEIAGGIVAQGGVEGTQFLKIPDRRRAIRMAFELATPGDTVLLTGKGHESCILVGHQKVAWDDRAVAREELRALTGLVAGCL